MYYFFWRTILTVNICDSGVLSPKEDAKALDEYIQKLENQKVEGLTEKQTNALIKTAKALRTAIIQSKKY
jgi:hypothetical protein